MDQPINLSGLHHCMVVHARYPIGETRVEREAQALISRGAQVDVICLHGMQDPATEVVDGANVYRLPVERHAGSRPRAQIVEYLLFFILAMFKLVALHLRHPYQVVQVHNLPDWLVFVGLFPRLTGARIILDIHDLMPEFYAARFNRPLDSWPVRLLLWQEKISCWFADQVITVTAGWRDTLIQRGVKPSKVSVVMNVADDQVFRPVPGGPPSPDGHFNLLYHGNVTHRYGIDLAIKAIDLVRQDIPVIHLHIHGRGDARPSLEAMTAELGLQNQISFSTRALLTSELPGMISSADVCLVPYRRDVFTDGILPTKLMEYAAMGVPVIAARTPAIASYFDETMLQFFEPGNVEDLAAGLRTLYSQPDRLATIARGVGQFTRRYTWQEISTQYAALVERLAGARIHRHPAVVR